MSPIIKNDSFVITKKIKNFCKKNKLFIFKHKIYGKLIKRLVNVDSSNLYWFDGNFYKSISSKDIGPIKKEQILGQIILSISKSSIKCHL